ncbi:MAG: polysaccharide deacetylase family protein [Bacteroidota bacterium]|nr:polysaccharide deacetylase family protein [Bacteroidota bacterium]
MSLKELNLFRVFTPYVRAAKPGFFLFGHGVTNTKRVDPLIQDLHMDFSPFARMIELWDKMGFRFISMEEAMEIVLNSKVVHYPWIHLTFDDGYKNNFTTIYPFLRSKKIPFTIFLSARNIIEQKRFDNYKINCALIHTSSEKREEILKPFRERLASSKNFRDDVVGMVKLYKYFSVPDKLEFISKIEELLSPVEWDKYNKIYNTEEVLSLENIQELSKDPLVYLGAHGYNHYILSTLSSEQITFEQSECRKIIFQLTGKYPEAYCYPNGKSQDCPAQIGNFCKENSYKVGFTTLKDKYTRKEDPFLIPRLPLSYRFLPKLFVQLL